MGNQNQVLNPIDINKPTIKSKNKLETLKPLSNKVSFSRLLPISIEEEDPLTQPEPEPFQIQQMNTMQYAELEIQQQKSLQQDQQAQEIKVRWNNFIKMKKKNYLDDYVILKQIGRGGFGRVYKVRSKYNGILRAAKKIKKTNLNQNEQQKLFQQMAIMQSLDHTNIAKLYQVYDYKSYFVLILQLCEGGQLFKRIASGKQMTQKQIAVIIRQIMLALLYLSHKKIVHRDIKPQNMLFDKDSNNLKIIDFGIAVEKKSKQKLTQRVGTPYYVAPQVLLKSYDQQCDVWSTGVIMYMMMTHRPPFKGNDQIQVMKAILNTQPMFNEDLKKKYSPQCIDLLKNMLIKNPIQRITALKAIQHPFIVNLGQLSLMQDKRDQVLDNIQNFTFKNQLQAVVYTYIVSQLMTNDEKKIFMRTFDQLDKNHDGVICKKQFESALKQRINMSQQKINLLMRVIDTNGSGQIDLTQFIVAGLKINEQFTKQHFEKAYTYFDIDHSGGISYEQIAFFLDGGKKESEEMILKIFRQVDENNDGIISKQQFIQLMLQNKKKTMNRSTLKQTKKL